MRLFPAKSVFLYFIKFNIMIIIGITGTLGAGKGTIVEYLIKNKNFFHYSVRGYLIKEIQKRGLEVNRDSMVLVANDLRKKHNPAFIIDELFKEALEAGQNAIIESIRTPGEIDLLRTKNNFYLLAVDADMHVRYERIVSRKSETDNISFETFAENEKREMNNSDITKQNLSECIKRADFVINNGGTLEELEWQIDKIFNKIYSK